MLGEMERERFSLMPTDTWALKMLSTMDQSDLDDESKGEMIQPPFDFERRQSHSDGSDLPFNDDGTHQSKSTNDSTPARRMSEETNCDGTEDKRMRTKISFDPHEDKIDADATSDTMPDVLNNSQVQHRKLKAVHFPRGISFLLHPKHMQQYYLILPMHHQEIPVLLSHQVQPK